MRNGISMIELVIAIVVMGIVVVSLPTIMFQTQNNLNYAMQQEAITATKAKAGYILAYDWDVNSYDDSSGYTRALNTDGIATASDSFDSVGTAPQRRVGHIEGDRRQRLSTDTPTQNINFGNKVLPHSNFNNGYPDIDDFDNDSITTTIEATDYDRVFEINQTTTIEYIADNLTSGSYNDQAITFNFSAIAAGGITNIKMIEVSSMGENINILLRAYATNLGETRPLVRPW